MHTVELDPILIAFLPSPPSRFFYLSKANDSMSVYLPIGSALGSIDALCCVKTPHDASCTFLLFDFRGSRMERFCTDSRAIGRLPTQPDTCENMNSATIEFKGLPASSNIQCVAWASQSGELVISAWLPGTSEAWVGRTGSAPIVFQRLATLLRGRSEFTHPLGGVTFNRHSKRLYISSQSSGMVRGFDWTEKARVDRFEENEKLTIQTSLRSIKELCLVDLAEPNKSEHLEDLLQIKFHPYTSEATSSERKNRSKSNEARRWWPDGPKDLLPGFTFMFCLDPISQQFEIHGLQAMAPKKSSFYQDNLGVIDRPYSYDRAITVEQSWRNQPQPFDGVCRGSIAKLLFWIKGGSGVWVVDPDLTEAASNFSARKPARETKVDT